MGYGDDVMASGFARGANARGKRMAFGDGKRIIWGPFSAEVFKNNPNIAPPGSERASDLEWCAYHKGNRGYNSLGHNRWIWNLNFRARPGEFFFSQSEAVAAAVHTPFHSFVLIEPNVPNHKSVAVNKQWPAERYQKVADFLKLGGHDVAQFIYPSAKYRLHGVEQISAASFREAAAILAGSALYIGAEGGLHHAAAALDIPAVVIFGGFIPPEVTGYHGHVNLTGGAKVACGSLYACQHCREALDAITVGEVADAASRLLEEKDNGEIGELRPGCATESSGV